MASMVDAPEPTRAEVSDVATATIQGADVVMLSDETANGSYPIEAVAAMKKTILYTQENWPVNIAEDMMTSSEIRRNAISRAAVTVAEEINAVAIIAETKSGATAANIAVNRPHLPICASPVRHAQLSSFHLPTQRVALCDRMAKKQARNLPENSSLKNTSVTWKKCLSLSLVAVSQGDWRYRYASRARDRIDL